MFGKSYNLNIKLNVNVEVNLGDCVARIFVVMMSLISTTLIYPARVYKQGCVMSRQSASQSSPRCLRRPGFINVVIILPCLLPLLLSVVVHHLSYFHPPAAVVSQRHVQQAKSCCLLSLFLIIPTILSINVRRKCQAVLKITRR